ncbi:MAG: hypothetical protein LT103_10255, partial [Burkholderiaceae bacterium]|nr:hypothetical protein [Burkholderiaceae bacterium]
ASQGAPAGKAAADAVAGQPAADAGPRASAHGDDASSDEAGAGLAPPRTASLEDPRPARAA